ncbi:uncharacterized protein LOC122460070 [Dermochelys coriacea]|uniref:uncharacterized protein LOC122460070 n=1 Tax=Dermochelys coriacea TaxID=27794 RepID=UPI001CA966C1|nr:uncharacterized protein LOC122460070 [Dermochelys coriacea]
MAEAPLRRRGVGLLPVCLQRSPHSGGARKSSSAQWCPFPMLQPQGYCSHPDPATLHPNCVIRLPRKSAVKSREHQDCSIPYFTLHLLRSTVPRAGDMGIFQSTLSLCHPPHPSHCCKGRVQHVIPAQHSEKIYPCYAIKEEDWKSAPNKRTPLSYFAHSAHLLRLWSLSQEGVWAQRVVLRSAVLPAPQVQPTKVCLSREQPTLP